MRCLPILFIARLFLFTPTWAIESPIISSQTQKMDGYKGDWGRAMAMMFNGIIPDDFHKFFDRDPERVIPREPNIVVSPADGVIAQIQSSSETIKLVIMLGMSDVHVQRIPISGKVRSMGTVGHGHLPSVDKLSWGNVQVVTTIDTMIGPCVIQQITGVWTSRIQNFIKTRQEVKLGDRMGRILLGSTVMLTLPGKVRLAVREYDRVFGGQTIIGRY